MATIKRISRTSKGSLTEGQTDDLIGGKGAFLSKGPATISPGPLFKDEEQRRAIYFENKDRLIKQTIKEEGPGARPAAFWQYETDITRAASSYLRHEYLIKNRLLFIGELDQIADDWLKILELYKPGLKGKYKTYCEGGEVYHGLAWPEAADTWSQEAALYGGQTLQAWEAFTNELKTEKGKGLHNGDN